MDRSFHCRPSSTELKDIIFYPLKPKEKIYDKEVLTNYPGELVRYDSSHHRFTPYAVGKCCLIISLDDYSRLILYTVLVERKPPGNSLLENSHYTG